MQISRMALVYDVKISQLGRKNLAVRFTLINLIHIKLAAAPKTPVAGREEIGKDPERGVESNGAPRRFRACLQN
jgi:hypothetical protein